MAVSSSSPERSGVGDTIGDTIAGAAPLGIGSSASSAVDDGSDIDMFAVTLEAGTTYTFSFEGFGASPLSDPLLRLLSATGAFLTEDDDAGAGTSSFLVFTPVTSGLYHLGARAFSNETGGYRLTTAVLTTGQTNPTAFTDNGKPHYSWDQAAIQLTRSGESWSPPTLGAPATVTYAFRSTAPAQMPTDTAGFQRFTTAQIAAAEAALAAWAQVANITFTRVGSGSSGEAAYSNAATILFANYTSGEDGAAAFAFGPGHGNTESSALAGDVWINSALSGNLDLTRGEYGFHTLLHEIGHAIGLDHPADYNAGQGQDPTYTNDAIYFGDNRAFTVMTYFGSTAIGGSLGLFASTPQLHDIAAMQRLYGANTSTRAGDTVYGFNATSGQAESSIADAAQAVVFSVWDAGGADTLDFNGYAQGGVIDLREESFSSVGPGNGGGSSGRFNVSIARGAVIENAIGGAGAETIFGNAQANVLTGNGGDDRIEGGAGDDVIFGDEATGGATAAAGGSFAEMLRAESDPLASAPSEPGGLALVQWSALVSGWSAFEG